MNNVRTFPPGAGIDNLGELPSLGVNLDRLPSINVKPKLLFGRWSEAAKYPIIKNFSHIIRWMFVNFATKDEIQEMINTQIASGGSGGSSSGSSTSTETDEKVTTMQTKASAIKPAYQQSGTLSTEVAQTLTLASLYNEVEQLRKVVAGITS